MGNAGLEKEKKELNDKINNELNPQIEELKKKNKLNEESINNLQNDKQQLIRKVNTFQKKT